MRNVTKLFNGLRDAHYIGPALVVAEKDHLGEVGIRIPALYGDAVFTAQSTIPETLATGDNVLAIQGEDESIYIIGLLRRTPQNGPTTEKLQLPDGSYAVAGGSTREPLLKIYSSQGKLMVQYDAAAEKVTIHAQEADLRLAAESGHLAFEATHAIRLEADRVDIVGRSKIGVSLGRTYESLKSKMTLLPGVIDMSAQKFQLAAKRGEINLEELYSRSDKAVITAKRLKTLAEKIDVAARSIVERTMFSYRWSEKLNQWCSGRVRMIARNTFHIKSRNAIVKSDEAVKVNADKIHLG